MQNSGLLEAANFVLPPPPSAEYLPQSTFATISKLEKVHAAGELLSGKPSLRYPCPAERGNAGEKFLKALLNTVVV